MSNKDEAVELEGVVVEALRGNFRVEIDNLSGSDPDAPKHEVMAHLAGKLRKNFIKIVPGDRVKVEVTPYDIGKGRITFRLKS